MLTVWVLVFYMNTINGGGPGVIDNIVSQDECTRLQHKLMKTPEVRDAYCFDVNKFHFAMQK